MSPAGFPHSDTLESQLGCQLLEAYRRLLRPSSAPGAKAFTVCPYKLATPTTQQQQTTTPHHPQRQQNIIDRRTQRCSRPLCSSQATNRHQPHTHHTPTPRRQFDGRSAHQTKQKTHLFPQDPTACHSPHTRPEPALPTTTEATAVPDGPAPGPTNLMSMFHPRATTPTRTGQAWPPRHPQTPPSGKTHQGTKAAP